VILNYNGEIKENTLLDNSTELNNKDSRDAFSIDLLKEYKTIKDEKSRNYPLFICDVDGKTYYVAPVMGKGLWAAVWGFIAIDESGNSISGTVFDHKSETPGLGAEISQDFFEDQFIGKLISNEETYKSVEVNKPGNPLNEYQVDGISGGTFTSVGVEEMMSRTLVVYHKYIKNLNRS
jgi:Na+-transporting NADH:ubiquinone oxidoreductase subunit C